MMYTHTQLLYAKVQVLTYTPITSKLHHNYISYSSFLIRVIILLFRPNYLILWYSPDLLLHAPARSWKLLAPFVGLSPFSGHPRSCLVSFFQFGQHQSWFHVHQM